MKRIVYAVLAAIVAVLIFTACDKNAHEGEWGLAVAFAWEDESDAATGIEDVRLWVYASDGTFLDEYHYGDAKGLASMLLPLPAGDYVLVAAVNLRAPYSFKETIGRKIAYEDLLFELDAPEASPEHAFYGTSVVSWDGSGCKVEIVPLRRVLSELSLKVEGVPVRSKLAVRVENAADGVFPARVADGKYGLASMGNANVVEFPEAEEKEGVIQTEVVRLMPTVADDNHSRLHLLLTLSDGSTLDCNAEAPRMLPSGKYLLSLKYGELSLVMSFSAVTINDWTEGWSLNGEVFDPEK